ncbi:uncharacterized protein PV09_04451 [Verruconis gallopava]|uniref:Inositol polyphosphate-related phosphatase domain-containing protein n=1 Tax=Verruconis gallopava TaxID=253628 RepID=A0A0D2ACT1_9PEZI|nr:uncharacterized protein PV09_04451 [Verruconis gallopava]KIW04718.1 hypothetical protein PV09_04451 [Verruconis gallopava]
MPTPLEIYLVTFNCARSFIDPALLGPSLFQAWPRDRASLPDVVAFSLQEVAPIAYSFLGPGWIDAYLRRIEESVAVASSSKGVAYAKVAVHNVGMTAAMVFVKSELSSTVTSVETAGVGVGWLAMGNKGGVGIRLTVGGAELTFVAMHLAPMEGMVLRRNQDWQDICRGLVFDGDAKAASRGTEREPLLLAGAGRPASGLYKPKNHIFLFGDLNYRTSHLSPAPLAYKTFPQPASPSDSPSDRVPLPDLLARDQLTQERLEGRVLHGFSEAPITFPPTYKYSHVRSSQPGPQAAKAGSPAAEGDSDAATAAAVVQEPSTWTWARHRWPSWCDRILFYPPVGITPGMYTALPLLPSSDHRPVALHVTLDPKTQEEVVPNDLRITPPFELDQQWRARRAAARRYELAVGVASWIALTGEGNMTVACLLGGALSLYFLLRLYGQGT